MYLLPTFTFFLATTSATSSSATARPYSEWLSTSYLSKSAGLDRHYVSALLHEAIARAGASTNNSTLTNYASKAISSLVSSTGTLTGWDPEYYSLDDLRIGNNLLYMWDQEGRKSDSKYKTAADALRSQINRFPRTPSGGFWHRKPQYPNQMWLDGLYMADQFYAQYTKYFQPENTTAWEDVAKQFDLIEQHCLNKTSHLLAHGYDESKKAVWADPVTGASPHVWDRAVGWYFMVLVEILQFWPKDLGSYARLKGYFIQLAEGLKRAQDKEGGWWLVMDEPYPGMKGNYIESSGTAMFVYGMLKGMRTGLIGEEYRGSAQKGYQVMLDKFVKHETNGSLSWEGTVRVGSLDKDASFEYYTSVPIAENDPKGGGPFIFASIEMEAWNSTTKIHE